MMKPSIYIETSIPSFYYEVRTEADNVARRQWTREWWDEHLSGYDAYTSEAVIEELEGGSFPGKANALELMEELPLLDINEPIIDIVATYISHRVMPNDPAGDALHLAVASFHKCDFFARSHAPAWEPEGSFSFPSSSLGMQSRKLQLPTEQQPWKCFDAATASWKCITPTS